MEQTHMKQMWDFVARWQATVGSDSAHIVYIFNKHRSQT